MSRRLLLICLLLLAPAGPAAAADYLARLPSGPGPLLLLAPGDSLTLTRAGTGLAEGSFLLVLPPAPEGGGELRRAAGANLDLDPAGCPESLRPPSRGEARRECRHRLRDPGREGWVRYRNPGPGPVKVGWR